MALKNAWKLIRQPAGKVCVNSRNFFLSSFPVYLASHRLYVISKWHNNDTRKTFLLIWRQEVTGSYYTVCAARSHTRPAIPPDLLQQASEMIIDPTQQSAIHVLVCCSQLLNRNNGYWSHHTASFPTIAAVKWCLTNRNN